MAIIQWPAGQTTGGYFNGNIIFHNRSGAALGKYFRTSNPRTQKQQICRTRLHQAEQLWTTLNAAQKTAWINFAAANPLIGVDGGPYIITGKNWFFRINGRLLTYGLAMVPNAPAFAQPAPPIGVSPTFWAGIQRGQVSFAPNPLGAGLRLVVYGHLFSSIGPTQPSDYLPYCTITGLNPASPYVISAPWLANFGEIQLDTAQLVRVHTLNAEGRLSTPAYGYDIVLP